MRFPFSLSLLFTFASVSTLVGQALPIPHDNARLRAALDTIKRQEPWTIDQEISLCEIPAPPYKEATRAAEYRRRLQALGIASVRVDSMGNVIAERHGIGNGPTVLIQGHLDTVFPEGTNVKVKRTGTLLAGPGIGDDCRGLAVVLSVARAFQRANVQTAGTVYFVGDVGEEGQGNLRGTRYLFTNSLKNRIDYFISVDGTGLDLKDHGVGSNRYRVTYKGPGGHSYGAFGIPNPIHALGRAIAAIGEIQVPASPKTTFNVGVISGGTSVNSIPFSATMDLDMRSETAEALDAVDKQVLERVLGYPVATFVRSPNDLASVVEHEPFEAGTFDFTKHALYIGFLAGCPKPDVVRKIIALKTPMDEFRVHGRELYWGARGRFSDSPVSGATLERTLGMAMTMRSVTTVRKLVAKLV